MTPHVNSICQARICNREAERPTTCGKTGLHTVQTSTRSLLHRIKTVGEIWELDNWGHCIFQNNGCLFILGSNLEVFVSFPLSSIFSLTYFFSLALWQEFKVACQTPEVQDLTKRMQLWLKELSVFQQAFRYNEQTSDDLLGVEQPSDRDLPIWLAAQRAVSRYEGLLSTVGPRGRLLKKLLSWIGLISPTPETPFELDGDTNASDPYARFSQYFFFCSHSIKLYPCFSISSCLLLFL